MDFDFPFSCVALTSHALQAVSGAVLLMIQPKQSLGEQFSDMPAG